MYVNGKMPLRYPSMAKVDYRRLPLPNRDRYTAILSYTLDELGASERTLDFLRHMLTESEVTMFARRIEIARRLIAGKTFEEIKYELRTGLNTIAVVDRWLQQKLRSYRSTPLDGHLTQIFQTGDRASNPTSAESSTDTGVRDETGDENWSRSWIHPPGGEH